MKNMFWVFLMTFQYHLIFLTQNINIHILKIHFASTNHVCTVIRVQSSLPLGEGSLRALPAGPHSAKMLAGGWGAPAPRMEAGEAGRVLAMGGRIHGMHHGGHTEGLDGGGVQSVTQRAGRGISPRECPVGRNTMRLRVVTLWCNPTSPIGGT